MNTNIILMGPIGVGKTTIGKLVAKKLGKKFIDLDDERARLHKETDYDNDIALQRYEQSGIPGWYEYQKPYELYSVKRILEECEDTVIAFGGGQSVYDDEDRQAEFYSLMEDTVNSFLLMPYEDDNKSLAFLESRNPEGMEVLNEIFVKSITSRKAAKYIIYTEDMSAKDIADTIAAKVNR